MIFFIFFIVLFIFKKICKTPEKQLTDYLKANGLSTIKSSGMFLCSNSTLYNNISISILNYISLESISDIWNNSDRLSFNVYSYTKIQINIGVFSDNFPNLKIRPELYSFHWFILTTKVVKVTFVVWIFGMVPDWAFSYSACNL